MQDGRPRRDTIEAERHSPDLLRDFLVDLECTTHSTDVWRLLVDLGKSLNLPFVDFISASNLADWRKTLFVRTSYDSSWLNSVNSDPDLHKWSYFQSHAMDRLTPVAVGIEFVDEYHHMPERRVAVLREAAKRGMRAGFSIPLRLISPPQSALITFTGDHSRRAMLAIIKAHGWTLNVAAIMAHQRYVMHFSNEFFERNEVSEKQRELMQLIGRGWQDKQIAAHLGVSISAVRQRFSVLLAKTSLANRAEVAALAMSIGLVPDPLVRRKDGPTVYMVDMDKGGKRIRVEE